MDYNEEFGTTTVYQSAFTYVEYQVSPGIYMAFTNGLCIEMTNFPTSTHFL